MDTESCKVLVQTDDAGRVTAINSDAFVSGDGWTAIDEGEGDRYRHAQNNYLLKPLTDERGVYRYKLVDGLVAQRTQAEMDAVSYTHLCSTRRRGRRRAHGTLTIASSMNFGFRRISSTVSA